MPVDELSILSHQDKMRAIYDIQRVAAHEPRQNNEPVLINDQVIIMKGRHKGYPKDLYHAELDSVRVLSLNEEQVLATKGYGTIYIRREYPAMWYRRNAADPRFKDSDFVEMRTVRDARHAEELKAERVRHGHSPWFTSIVELDKTHPAPDAPLADPSVEIARLKGELAGRSANPTHAPSDELAEMRKEMARMSAELAAATKRGPGRPANLKED